MRISLKGILILWIVLVVAVGGLFLSAYSKLQPETFIALLNEQVQKNYPGAKLSIGKIDYRLSVDFNLSLKEVILTRNSKILGSIGQVELKVPWWIPLINRGNAQINVNRLEIYVDHEKPDSLRPIDANSPAAAKVVVRVPSYLAGVKYTLRAKDVSIKDTRTSRRYVTVAKLLVREFQYGKNSAFELNIPIEITHKLNRYTSDLWLFGDLTPGVEEWKLNYRGEFKTIDTADKFQIEDLILTGSSTVKPAELNISSVLNLMLEKESIGSGTLIANNNEFSIVMQFSKLPLSYLGLVDEQLKNPFLSKLEGFAEGPVRITKRRGQDITMLNGRLMFDGNIQIGKTPIPGKWQLNFQDSRWETSFINSKGELSFFRRSSLDFKKGDVAQYIEELGFTNMELQQVMAVVQPLQGFLEQPQRPYFNTTISLKNCTQDQVTVDGIVKYGVLPDSRYYQVDLSDSMKNDFSLNYQGKSLSHSINLAAKKFPWSKSYQFLGPLFLADQGTVDGKVEGRWSEAWYDGTWLVQTKLEGTSGLGGFLPSTMHSIAQVFSLDSFMTPKQSWHASVKNKNLEIYSLQLENENPAKITGLIYPASSPKSSFTLTYPKNPRWTPVKKAVPEFVWYKESI
jgi:hypothetical protein